MESNGQAKLLWRAVLLCQCQPAETPRDIQRFIHPRDWVLLTMKAFPVGIEADEVARRLLKLSRRLCLSVTRCSRFAVSLTLAVRSSRQTLRSVSKFSTRQI